MSVVLILEDDDARISLFHRNLIGHTVIVVKNVDQCINILKTQKVDYLCLDHDLDGQVYVLHGGKHQTGWDVAKWLSENPDKIPPIVVLHSLYEEGRRNMKKLIPNAIQFPFFWLMPKMIISD